MRRLLVLAFVLFVAACAREGDVRVLGPAELPDDIYARPTPSPTAAPEFEIRLWFVLDGRLVPVTRSTPRTESRAESALRALMSGPTAEEEASGLRTAIPRDAELLELTVRDGVASVDLSKEFELSADQRVLLQRVGQVVYTLTGAPGVGRVRFLIDGEPASVLGEDGAAHEEVGRSDYSGLTQTPAPTVEPTPAPG